MEREQHIGHYRLIRRIGEGGMGDVFEAIEPRIERRAAIKLMHPTLNQGPDFAARFLNEARAVNRVRHPGLVNIYEFGETPEGTLYIVMEYLEGETLRARLNSLGPGRGLDPAVVVRMARQLASTLIAVHAAGITHRDLKPANVMLVADPDVTGGERAKLFDFGIAKMSGLHGGVRTLAGVALGTPHYMAPEQCYNASQVDGKADVYSLGVMLYEALAGKRPIEDDDCRRLLVRHLMVEPELLSLVAPNVPAELAALVMSMLTKDANARPTMEQVLGDLDSMSSARAQRSNAFAPYSPKLLQDSLPGTAYTRKIPVLRPRNFFAFLFPVAAFSGILWLFLRATSPSELCKTQHSLSDQPRVALAVPWAIAQPELPIMESKESLPQSLGQGSTIPLNPKLTPPKKEEAKARGHGKEKVRAPDVHPLKESLKKMRMGPDDVVPLD